MWQALRLKVSTTWVVLGLIGGAVVLAYAVSPGEKGWKLVRQVGAVRMVLVDLDRASDIGTYVAAKDGLCATTSGVCGVYFWVDPQLVYTNLIDAPEAQTDAMRASYWVNTHTKYETFRVDCRVFATWPRTDLEPPFTERRCLNAASRGSPAASTATSKPSGGTPEGFTTGETIGTDERMRSARIGTTGNGQHYAIRLDGDRVVGELWRAGTDPFKTKRPVDALIGALVSKAATVACTTDSMSDDRSCVLVLTNFDIALHFVGRETFPEVPATICLVEHDYPAKVGAVRINKMPPVTTNTKCFQPEQTREIWENLKIGNRISTRTYRWPDRVARDAGGEIRAWYGDALALTRYLYSGAAEKLPYGTAKQRRAGGGEE